MISIINSKLTFLKTSTHQKSIVQEEKVVAQIAVVEKHEFVGGKIACRQELHGAVLCTGDSRVIRKTVVGHIYKMKHHARHKRTSVSVSVCACAQIKLHTRHTYIHT